MMCAAAENLTPITLEFGGTTPVIIDSSAKLKDAAQAIIYGKLLNGGQACMVDKPVWWTSLYGGQACMVDKPVWWTSLYGGQACIAQDYVLIESSQEEAFIKELQHAAQTQFSNPEELTGPTDERQLHYWNHLVIDTLDRGAKRIPLLNNPRAGARRFEPIVITNVQPDSLILQEEIFGPILPILTVKDTAAAIQFVNERSHPLALYWFGKNKVNLRKVLNETHSGGVTINDTLLHITINDLPFGGVGASGIGKYHGKEGFDTFSHQKSVLEVQGFLGLNLFKGTKMVRPPYGKKWNGFCAISDNALHLRH
nr:aldehyde dehydrogenase family protein [Polynucleobacter necessarius]